MQGLLVSFTKLLLHCLTMNRRERKEKDATVQVHHHALSTSTSTLRNHLNKVHRAEYNTICTENSWKNHLKDTEKQKAEAAKVVARAASRESFSMDELLKRIAGFIVADDQVCLFLFQVICHISSNHNYSRSELLNVQSSGTCSFLLAATSKI